MAQLRLTVSDQRRPEALSLEISPRLWKMLTEEATHEGVDPAIYLREAIISRVHYDRGARERRRRGSREPRPKQLLRCMSLERATRLAKPS